MTQALLQRGVGAQPLPKRFESKTAGGKTYKVLKKGAPSPPVWGLGQPLGGRLQPRQDGRRRQFGPLARPAAVRRSRGFRELIAGILWVKADSFFDTGNYDAILPLIRLVTILDPHQIDVYATGMWHIGYNFTDEEQRSDRRYIPAALALGKEGYQNNPNTYEMFFETGWMWYHKIDDDYEHAVDLFLEAREARGHDPRAQEPARRWPTSATASRRRRSTRTSACYDAGREGAEQDQGPVSGALRTATPSRTTSTPRWCA